MNPGGLYGKATPQNFPEVNDYRNTVVAEALKVLGFVNRFSRGVLRVKEELKENGNGEPQFSLDLVTAFLVTEPISSKSALFLQSGGKDEGKEGKDEGKEELDFLSVNIIQLIKSKPNIKYAEIMDNLGVGETAVYRSIKELKEKNIIKREKGRKNGYWVILKEKN